MKFSTSKNLLILILLIYSVLNLFSQCSLSDEFYFCYPANHDEIGASLILSSSNDVEVNIHNESLTFDETITILADSTEILRIPARYMVTTSGVVESKGFKITSSDTITASLLSSHEPCASNDLLLLYPPTPFSTHFILMCYYGLFFYDSPSNGTIVATEDNTNVTIIPSANLLSGQPAGIPFSIELDEYETYRLSAGRGIDLTGTEITSDRPICCYGGSQCSYVPVDIGACDFIAEQIPPVDSWGNEFNLLPFKPHGSERADVYRILAAFDGTIINVENSEISFTDTLDKGEVWETNPSRTMVDNTFLCSACKITSSNPVLVGQYMTGVALLDDTFGDPAFSLVPSIEQYDDEYRFLVPNEYYYNYITISIQRGFEGTVYLDGVLISPEWTEVPSSEYLIASHLVTEGSHYIQADSPFMLLLHGYDNRFASYASVAGTNLISLRNSIRKKCLRTPIQSGSDTRWQITYKQRFEERSTELCLYDTLPEGFSFSEIEPMTIELFGSASRSDVMEPVEGDTILAWGHFDLDTGDSLRITFSAMSELGMTGEYNNAVNTISAEGHESNNNHGYHLSEDNIRVVDPFNYHIVPGWNLLSYPYRNETELLSIYPDADIFYSWDNPHDTYEIITDSDAGYGYWVLSTIRNVYSVYGVSPINEFTVDLYPGWNLIGSLHRAVPTFGIEINEEIIPPIYGYDGSYYATDSIIPGFGYWVFAEDSIELEFSGSDGFPYIDLFMHDTVCIDSGDVTIEVVDCDLIIRYTEQFNCNMDSVNLDISIIGSRILITEHEFTSTPADCDCFYEMVTIVRLRENADYLIEMWKNPYDSSLSTLIRTIDFEVTDCLGE